MKGGKTLEGRVPEKELFERSRFSKLPAIFEGIVGNGPLNKLLLTENESAITLASVPINENK